MSLPAGMTIRISKNLRICADCHDATTLISKLEKRSIIIADPYLVHKFCDGACSCDNFFLEAKRSCWARGGRCAALGEQPPSFAKEERSPGDTPIELHN